MKVFPIELLEIYTEVCGTVRGGPTVSARPGTQTAEVVAVLATCGACSYVADSDLICTLCQYQYSTEGDI